ncbi:MAG TPA: hypothetical protein VGF43_04545 [Dongiaceae bacterium]|jgi:hypothetical protein
MTHALVHWLWRLFSTATHPAPDVRQTERPPMKIAVERLPDYLWRELGFTQRRPSSEVDDWPA